MFGRIASCAMVLVLSACAGQATGATDPEEPSTTISAETTTTPTSVTTTLAAPTSTESTWDAVSPWRGGPAGEYRTTLFEPAFRFTTSSAFLPVAECAELATIFKKQGEVLSGFWFYNYGHDSTEETLAYLASKSALSLGETAEAEIGGAKGVRLVVDFVENSIQGPHCEQTFQIDSGDTQTVYVVDVAGEIVTIFIDDIPGVSDERAQQFMDSITWKALSGS